jgi:hypothetical protein
MKPGDRVVSPDDSGHRPARGRVLRVEARFDTGANNTEEIYVDWEVGGGAPREPEAGA